MNFQMTSDKTQPISKLQWSMGYSRKLLRDSLGAKISIQYSQTLIESYMQLQVTVRVVVTGECTTEDATYVKIRKSNCAVALGTQKHITSRLQFLNEFFKKIHTIHASICHCTICTGVVLLHLQVTSIDCMSFRRCSNAKLYPLVGMHAN